MSREILVFDDGRDLSSAVLEALRDEGFEPVAADPSKPARPRGADDVAPLVLLGLGPEVHAAERLVEVHRHNPESPIILLATSIDADTAAKAFCSGVVDCLGKPVEPGPLLQSVKRHWARSERPREALAAVQDRFEIRQDDQQGRSQAQFFQALIDAIPNPIYYKDCDGVYRGCNKAFEQIVGYGRDQIIGRTAFDIANADLATIYHESDVELLSRGGAQVYESEAVTPEGRHYDVLFHKATFAATADRPGGIVGSMTDISARKRVEQQLRWSEEHFRQLFETSPDAILLTDLVSGRILEVNQTFAVLSGYSQKEVVGKTSLELGLWADEEDRHRFIEVISERGLVSNYEAQFRRKDGTLAIGLVSGRVLSQREEPCLIAAIRDISEIREFEEVLQKEQLRYRKLSQEFQIILERIPDSLTLWTQEKRVSWTNRQAKSFFLVGPEQAVGQSCKDLCKLIHDDCDCPISRCFTSGTDEQSLMRDQSGGSWSLKAFPIKDEAGRVTRVISLASDITESLRLREEARRSAHLAALGELAAGVAHEVNNPTGLILLNMPLLQEAFRDLVPLLEQAAEQDREVQIAGLPPLRLQQELPEIIDEVFDAARRIKEIVAELKDFAQVKDPSLYEDVNLNEVVQKALRLLANALRKATDHFAVELADPPLHVRGTSQKLEQVVVNLLLNACQALTRRDEAIAVSLYHDKKTGMNCIRIWDEGSGIEPAVLSQVMDPFFTTKRENGGTGLGLSVSARIIEEFGGHLSLESLPGQGTTATVTLPVCEQESP